MEGNDYEDGPLSLARQRGKRLLKQRERIWENGKSNTVINYFWNPE